MNKRAVIYTRVSTDEQAEHGYSLQSQLEACQVYARNSGYVVVAELSDDYSGAELDRPGLNIVRQMIREREMEAVVVYSPDRWTRNLAHMLLLRENMLEAGVDLLYVNRGKVNDTPEGRMMDNIEGVFGEYWREKIIENSKRGRDQKAKNGRLPLMGTTPYGYHRTGRGRDAELVKHERELEIVKKMFSWYVHGNGAGEHMSFKKIAGKMNLENEKARSEGELCPYPNLTEGVPWSNIAVRRILTNELYAGRGYYGKTRAINKKTVPQPKSEWIPIDVPHLAVIDRDTWEAVAVRAKRNRQQAKRNRKRNYLLSGHFRCGTCKKVMIGHTRPSHVRYQCGSYWAGPGRPEPCQTANRSVVTHKAENAVWEFLQWALRDDTLINESLKKMTTNREAGLLDRREQLETTTRLIIRTERKMDRLMGELEAGRYTDEVLLEAFRRKLSEVAQEKESLERERHKLEFEIGETEISPTLAEDLKAIAGRYRANLPNATYEVKRMLLDQLNVEVVFYWEEGERWLEVTCEFTDEPIKLRIS